MKPKLKYGEDILVSSDNENWEKNKDYECNEFRK